MINTKTARTVFSADSLVSGKKTAAQAMSGRMVMPLIQTKDYDLEMVVYANNNVEGQPVNGVFYEVTTFNGEKEEVYSSISSEMAIKYADKYSQMKHEKVRVNIQFDMINRDEYEVIKDGTYPKAFDFKDAGFTIEQVTNETVMKGYGFISQKDAKKAHKKVKGLFVPSLAK